jgi:uncharacterized protein YggE
MRLFSLLLLALPLFAGNDMTITATEQVSQQLKPDVLQGYLNFRETSKSADTIKKDLNAIVAEMKRLDPKAERCSGGGYSVSPRYSYKDHKQQFDGYGGSLSFNCEFAGIETYNVFTGSIAKVTAPAVRQTQGALNWVVSEKKRTAAKAAMHDKLILNANAKAAHYAALTRNECRVSSITFGSVVRPAPIALRAMAENKVDTQSPMQAKSDVTATATVVYTCGERTR